MDLIIETAKNGELTCKFKLSDGRYKYIYSKYAPSKVRIESINPNMKRLILIGGGLGYEYERYKELFNGEIFVWELSPIFREQLIRNYPDIRLLDVKAVMPYIKMAGTQVMEHLHIMEPYLQQYLAIKRSKTDNKTIAILKHTSIQKDCTRAFRELGYEPIELEWTITAEMKKKIATMNPLFIFSINFSRNLSIISKELAIPYVSWTVDTPAYSLYDEAIYHANLYCFIYDEVIVNRLQQTGIEQVYYLPVAALIQRFDQIQLTDEEYSYYQSDIAFLGSRCANNEFMNSFNDRFSPSLKAEFDEIVLKQCFNNEAIIERAITPRLINLFEKETSYYLFKEDERLLTKEQRLVYLLGRYHSYIERTALMHSLQSLGQLHVYGEASWREYFSTTVYKGIAENDQEMPKVFKASKININNIRSFVESGLPQRVFDVLACKGFLVTNNNADVEKYFKDRQDLVVYRDEQDLKEIIKYYLIHDKERSIIAQNGYEKIKKFHTFEQRLKQICEIIES